jgi:hypothetical protein
MNLETASGPLDLSKHPITDAGRREYLSLYKIETALSDLMQIRDEAFDNLTIAQAEHSEDVQQAWVGEIAKIDQAIREYVKREVSKVDGIRAVWKTLQMLETNAAAEAELQHQRSLAYRRNLDRLKEACREVMESMPWREGKPKRIEGGTGSLLLKTNGGKQAVVISDESLVPDELCNVTVTMSADDWEYIVHQMKRNVPSVDRASDQEISGRFRVKREVSLSLIGEALQRPCQECHGEAVDQSGTGFPCSACGGSGKAGVPGCSLAPRGSHVELR